MRQRDTCFFVLSVTAGLMLGYTAAAQNPDDSHFDWPMGREEPTGNVVTGHDIDVLRNFDRLTFINDESRKHAGVDLRWRPRGWPEAWGTNTVGAPVYAAANGQVVCDNRLASGFYASYPGRVVVIRHNLPGGSVYSMYGHLQFPPPYGGGNTELEDPDAIEVGATVRRGDQIGRVIRWPDTEVADVRNTHLHYEIRSFERWPEDDRCQGPGYAPVDDEPEDWGWMDPVDFYYEHRPPFPAPVLNWSEGETEIRNVASDRGGRSLGTLPPSARVTAYGVKQDQEKDDDDWWYEIRQGPGEQKGWIKGFLADAPGSDVIIGEPERSGAGWQMPSGAPLIHYRFDEADLFDLGYILNWGKRRAQNLGMIEGDADLVPGPEAVIVPGGTGNNYAIGLDGDTAFVEVQNSQGLRFREGVAVSALVRRETNLGEDAVLSKWYGEDQWLLTFYADGYGRLIFTVRLSNGAYVTADYPIPSPNYLGKWGQVAASYEGSGEPLRNVWTRSPLLGWFFGRGRACRSRALRPLKEQQPDSRRGRGHRGSVVALSRAYRRSQDLGGVSSQSDCGLRIRKITFGSSATR